MNEKIEKELRDRRQASLTAAELILSAAETEERGLTAEEDAQVRAQMEEATRLQAELEGAQRAKTARMQLDEAKRYAVPEVMRAVPPGEDPPALETPTIRIAEHGARAYEKGDSLGAIVAARMRFGAWAQPQAINWARKAYGESSPQCRALQQSTFTAGGATIAENFVGAEFIELLRATAKVRQAGARQVTLTNGTFTTPKMTGGASFTWISTEGDNAAPSQPTFGQVKLTEKKGMALVPISNDLRRNSNLETERIVRDDMVRATANAEDIAFLKGDGLNGSPKGIYYWLTDTQRTNSQGTTLANIRTDIRTVKNALSAENAPMVRRAFFMHSRSADYMGWDLVDGNSNLVFPQMQQDEGAVLAGARVYRDNNISITLTSTSSEIYYVEMSEFFIGDSMEMELEILENAVYADASGTLRSGVSRDESVIRLIRKVDCGLRHVESAHVLEAVDYGA